MIHLLRGSPAARQPLPFTDSKKPYLLVRLLVARDDARTGSSLRRGRQRIPEGPIVRAGILSRVRHDGHIGEALAVQRRPGACVLLLSTLFQTWQKWERNQCCKRDTGVAAPDGPHTPVHHVRRRHAVRTCPRLRMERPETCSFSPAQLHMIETLTAAQFGIHRVQVYGLVCVSIEVSAEHSSCAPARRPADTGTRRSHHS